MKCYFLPISTEFLLHIFHRKIYFCFTIKCLHFFALLLFYQSVTAQVTFINELDWTRIPSHPFLFANNNRIHTVISQKDKVSQQLLFIIKQAAEKRLSAPNIKYPNQASNMTASRDVQGRIISLALAYRLFNDKRFLDRAKQELLQLATLKDWGVGHFLDVGEASLAAGIGLDWLYNELTATERKTVANAIKSNALLPSLQVQESNNNSTWVNGNFNWNPVCHAGLIVGALAIAEFEPILSKQIIDRGVKNIPIAGDAYSPDGAFAEGPSYWSYGTSFYVFAIEALRSAFGYSSGLEKVPGFLKTADYKIQMEGATGEDYNYSDYHHENLNQPIMLWFANELKRPDLAKKELRSIGTMHEMWSGEINKQSVTYALPTDDGDLAQSRHTPFEILWWKPSLSNQKNIVTPPLHWTATGLMPIAVMRSAWNKPKATFVAIKGGTPDNSHGHMDAGSFILEANGVRWALDLGTESYNKMRAAKLDLWNYGQNSSRWTTFRCGPDGHNIPRFNNQYQLINGKAEIKKLADKSGAIGNIVNLSTLYANEVSTATRTVLLLANNSVSITDEWATKDSAITYAFQWLTKATVTKTNDGLLLQQNGESISLKILQPTTINDVIINIEDVAKPRQLQDSPNPDLKKIIFKIKTAANAKGVFTISIIPRNSKIK